MLRERIISAVIGVPVIIAFLLLGKYFFAFLIAAIAVVCIDELYSMLILRDFRPNILFGIIGGVLIVAGAAFGGSQGLILALAIMVVMALVGQIRTQRGVADTALALFGLLYVAFTLSHMVLHYSLSFGLIGVLLVFIGTWVSDISAYGLGRVIGRTKLAPSISANKTVEGLISGILAPALVLAVLFTLGWLPFAAEQGIFLAMLKGLAMGLLIGIAAPVGDLVESRIKREVRVKDSGAIIPGHGGFLDRFDSLLFTAVAGYYYWLIIV